MLKNKITLRTKSANGCHDEAIQTFPLCSELENQHMHV